LRKQLSELPAVPRDSRVLGATAHRHAPTRAVAAAAAAAASSPADAVREAITLVKLYRGQSFGETALEHKGMD
jgi:hypothetical protein